MDYTRIRNFINSYSRNDEDDLEAIYQDAVEKGVPVIRREARDFMKTLLAMTRAKSILEIGTAVGYSSSFMARCSGAKIDTLELDPERVKEARANHEKLNLTEQITVYEGDAVDSLDQLIAEKKDYDFIFIDAAKAQYMNYLDRALQLSHAGTVIVTDNLLTDGEVLESHFLVEKRDRTIHDRMREYILRIKTDEKLETALTAVGDGMAVSVVK